MDIIRAQEQSKDLHEQFHAQLERAQDGFSVIADYYGRGVFNKVRHTSPLIRRCCSMICKNIGRGNSEKLGQ